jgi:hypothetical protein
MRKVFLLSAIILCIAAVQAFASGPVVLTFEGLGNHESINDYYNGGLGSTGSGPGPNYGITFTSDSLAIISGASGGDGNFSGAPSGVTIAFFLDGAGDTMNVAAGFDTGFSFFYSAIAFPGTVTVWDGLNGTGSLLATINLPVTPSGGAPECTYGAYCPWVPIGVAFAGTAHSVVFSGTANYIGFDDITLGSDKPGGDQVPEPATMALLGTGLVGVAGKLRKKK